MSILQQDRELLTSFAESVGLSKLDNEIEDLLLSDLESKMLEIVQEAKKFMRHSKRDILKTEDIKHAMDKLSIPVLLPMFDENVLERIRIPVIFTLHL
jgi:transcription initiation factor TFIID subunit 6